VRIRISAAVSVALLGALFAFAGTRAALAQGPSAAGAQGADVSAEEAARGTRVPLAQATTAFDGEGREALSATLLTQALAGTPEAPARNARFVFRHAGRSFYNYVTGFVTFYDEAGTRCGSGLFAFEAAAPGERVETDTPGLRLTCTPAAWRVVATTLLTPAGDVAQPRPAAAASRPRPMPRLRRCGAAPAAFGDPSARDRTRRPR